MYIYSTLMGLNMTSDDIQIMKLPMEDTPQLRWRRAALVIGLTLMVSAPGCAFLAQEHQIQLTSSNLFWRVEGNPCAPLGADRFRGASRSPSVTTYDGVTFERHGGVMVCTHRTRILAGALVRFPVCKFDQPDYLSVRAAGQERFYDLTMGQAAAVGVVNGQVRCVVSQKFEL
jgi:hypothetical protein